MKCPHCGYAHGSEWVDDDPVDVKGECGDFYELPLEVSRTSLYNYSKQTRTLYACPSCTKTFIE
jgi:predicted RNA-binding Zn-ribbon protein involved in translation (DUF1610 family)